MFQLDVIHVSVRCDPSIFMLLVMGDLKIIWLYLQVFAICNRVIMSWRISGNTYQVYVICNRWHDVYQVYNTCNGWHEEYLVILTKSMIIVMG